MNMQYQHLCCVEVVQFLTANLDSVFKFLARGETTASEVLDDVTKISRELPLRRRVGVLTNGGEANAGGEE